MFGETHNCNPVIVIPLNNIFAVDINAFGMRVLKPYHAVFFYLLILRASSNIDKFEASIVGEANISTMFVPSVLELVFDENSDPSEVARNLCFNKEKPCSVLVEAAVALSQNKLHRKELKYWSWSDEFQ